MNKQQVLHILESDHRILSEVVSSLNPKQVEAVEKWRTKGLKEVLDEWEKSFQIAIERVEKLTNEEWDHQSNKDTWSNGDPVTIYSLFDYEYEGTSHEGGHSKQIREFFKL